MFGQQLCWKLGLMIFHLFFEDCCHALMSDILGPDLSDSGCAHCDMNRNSGCTISQVPARPGGAPGRAGRPARTSSGCHAQPGNRPWPGCLRGRLKCLDALPQFGGFDWSIWTYGAFTWLIYNIACSKKMFVLLHFPAWSNQREVEGSLPNEMEVNLWQIEIRTMSPVSTCQRQRIQKRAPVQLKRAWCPSCLSEIALNLQARLPEVMAAFGKADSLDESRFIKIRSHCLCKRRTCPRSVSSCRHFFQQWHAGLQLCSLDLSRTFVQNCRCFLPSSQMAAYWGLEWAQTPGAQQVFLQICADPVPTSKLNGSLEATMWLERFCAWHQVVAAFASLIQGSLSRNPWCAKVCSGASIVLICLQRHCRKDLVTVRGSFLAPARENIVDLKLFAERTYGNLWREKSRWFPHRLFLPVFHAPTKDTRKWQPGGCPNGPRRLGLKKFVSLELQLSAELLPLNDVEWISWVQKVVGTLNGSLKATMWLERFCAWLHVEKSLMCKGLLWGKHCL